MRRRKQIIINKEFQYKTTFSIIGLVLLLGALVIAAIAFSIVYNNHRIEKINSSEDKIVQYLQVKSITEKASETDKKAMKEIAVTHSDDMKTMNAMIRNNKILLGILIGFVLLHGIALYLILIRKTHRIAGPIFVMTRYMQEVIDGKFPQVRAIRRKDDLQEFYSVFTRMVNALRERYSK